MRQISPKQAKRLEEYRRIRERLYWLSDGRSEWSGAKPCYSEPMNDNLEPHHIFGRVGRRLVDPFNIILLTAEEHRQAHQGKITKQQLADKVMPLRKRQGF